MALGASSDTRDRTGTLLRGVRLLVPNALSRPLHLDGEPPARWTIIASFVLLLVAAGVTIVRELDSVGWQVPPAAIMLALLFFVTDMLPIEVAPGSIAAVGEVFMLTAFLVLPSPGIAAFVGLTVLLSLLYSPSSWFRALTWAVNSLVGQLGALSGLVAFLTLTPESWHHPATAVLAAYLGARVFDALVNLRITWWAGQALGTPHATSYLRLLRKVFLGETALVVALGLELPIALAGFYLYQTAPWAVALLFAPFAVLWFAMHKVAQLRHAHQRMQIDPHTGLANRARFFELGADEVAAASRYGHQLWLIMGDIDDFKRVNDTRGHVKGDEVLRRTAAAMHTATEGRDVLAARYGGEEFAVLAPAFDGVGVTTLAADIRAAVEAALAADFGTTISFGVAAMQPGDDLVGVIERADKALYAAKIAGKNRVFEWINDERCVEIDEAAVARRNVA